MDLIKISRKLSRKVSALSFAKPVTHVYNPLSYAKKSHEDYLLRYGNSSKETLLVGMNPGPFGMAQTGVPFGDVSMVRDWLAIEESVKAPKNQHPKRPIHGFDCPRGEVSGTRIWGWTKKRFKTPERFFKRFFVWNYCPLCFMEESGKNRTPDKLSKNEREELYKICDEALYSIVESLQPRHVIGIGNFAYQRIKAVVEDDSINTGTILHPSPASPAANKDWEGKVEEQFQSLGIKLS